MSKFIVCNVHEKYLQYAGKTDGENDPILDFNTKSAKEALVFTWNNDMLVCTHPEFPKPNKTHFFGVADGGGHSGLFCAHDADTGRGKYKWTQTKEGQATLIQNVGHPDNVKYYIKESNHKITSKADF